MPGPPTAALAWMDAATRQAARDRASRLDGMLETLLACGGDERIWPDPRTGRNRYGTSLTASTSEVSFASSTANPMSAVGFAAARSALRSLLDCTPSRHKPLEVWFDELRAGVLEWLGCPSASPVLTASGTDGELLAVAIAQRLLQRPLTNVLIAPGETGSGVPIAAAGKNFVASSSLGAPARAQEPIEGLHDADIEVANIEIRCGSGAPRTPAEIDRDAARAAARALERGRGVLLHVLDTSKTGLAGPSRETAELIAALAPGRVLVLVDACQLRAPARRLADDLARGFMVLITGSKFAGGPPFCGALLLPAEIAEALRRTRPPKGLSSYSARLDWPGELQATFAREFACANVGAGLRWAAALAELARLRLVPRERQEAIVAHFSAQVLDRARACPFTMACVALEATPATPSIVPLLPRHACGAAFDAPATTALHAKLRDPLPGAAHEEWRSRTIHVGQAVAIGPQAALRVCASAAHVADVGERMAQGASLLDAFAPIAYDLEALFAKWALIAAASA